MYRRNALKQRLAAGDRAFGCFVNSCSPIVTEILALAGYDCLMIDREHSPADLMTALAMMNAIRTTPCTALMRVVANDVVELKRALDIGVEGVMIPAINSAAEACAAVAACRYPPAGVRGMAISIVRAADYGFKTAAYTETAAADLLVICQIESRAAADNIDEIAAVDGIDMLFIGPYDLSASLGYLGTPDHPAAAARIAAIETAVKRSGKWLGGIPTPQRSAEALFAAGYDFVLAGADLVMLRETAGEQAAALRRATGRT